MTILRERPFQLEIALIFFKGLTIGRYILVFRSVVIILACLVISWEVWVYFIHCEEPIGGAIDRALEVSPCLRVKVWEDLVWFHWRLMLFERLIFVIRLSQLTELGWIYWLLVAFLVFTGVRRDLGLNGLSLHALSAYSHDFIIRGWADGREAVKVVKINVFFRDILQEGVVFFLLALSLCLHWESWALPKGLIGEEMLLLWLQSLARILISHLSFGLGDLPKKEEAVLLILVEVKHDVGRGDIFCPS